MDNEMKIGFARFLKQLYIKDKLTKEYLTKDNLTLLFWYELTGSSSDPTLECITDDFIRHTVNCDNELIRFCIRGLKHLGDSELAEELESNYIIIKTTFAPSVTDQIRMESERLERKKRLWFPFKIAFLIILLTCISTQYLVSSSLGINYFSVVIESMEDKLGLRVPENYPRNNQELLSYSFRWMPKGYEKTKTVSERTTYGEVYHYEYSCEGNEPITLTVERYLDTSFDVDIETNSSIIKFTSKNKSYYIAENYTCNQIIWNEYNLIYKLYGNVEKSVLEDIITKN